MDVDIALPWWADESVFLQETVNLTNPVTQVKEEVTRPTYRYIILHGGRGSGKSMAIADILILLAIRNTAKVLCTREFFVSIKESVYALLQERIEFFGLGSNFKFTNSEIICLHNKSKFMFKGLKKHLSNIKSTQGTTHVWIEEADTLTRASWLELDPTFRKSWPQVFMSLNPKLATDFVYQEFIEPIAENRRTNAYVLKQNWYDNEYFPHSLNELRLYDKNRDIGLYNHVWEGSLLENSDAQIFKDKFIVDDFIIDLNEHAYFGLDWGYIDPFAAVRCYIKENVLYVTHEVYETRADIDKIVDILNEKRIPGIRNNRITADSSHPGNIAYIKKNGFNIMAAEKGQGSVKDGITHLRSYDKIVIHRACQNMIREMTYYSYKVNERSGDVTEAIVENQSDHLIDALRYSVERIMKRKSGEMKNYSNLEAALGYY